MGRFEVLLDFDQPEIRVCQPLKGKLANRSEAQLDPVRVNVKFTSNTPLAQAMVNQYF